MKKADTDSDLQDQNTIVIGGAEPDDPDTVATMATEAREIARAAGAPTGSSTAAAAALEGGGLGLGTKFSLAAAGLVFAILAIALFVTSQRANEVAERSMREDLGRAPTLFRAWRADLESRLLAQLRSLSEEAGTKALYADDVNPATVWEFAVTDNGLGAKTVFMVDDQARVLARSDKPVGEGAGRPFTPDWVTGPLTTGRDATAAIVEKGELAMIASVAVVSGEGEESAIDGALSAAFPFAAAEVEALEGITRGNVVFLTNTARRDEPAEAAVTATSESLSGDELIGRLADAGEIETLLGGGQEVGPIDLSLGGESHLVMAVPVLSSRGKAYGAFVVTRSRAAEMAAFVEIQKVLLGVGAVLLVLTVPLSFLMGRRIAQPLAQLTRGAHAIREGKLDVELPGKRRDEVGTLARAFQGMVGELREKRALQELLEDMSRREADRRQNEATSDMAAVPGAELAIGNTFGGRYEVLGSLGQGGMGAVYHARDVELDDAVALKVLKSEAFQSGSQALETLKKEIRLARKITHPNVVRVHDFAEAQGVRFISMEYVPGTTLRHLVSDGRKLQLGPGLQVSKQLCRGLAAIHEAGILHRDMKPENVMVLPNGMVKLMDFGIAEVLVDESERKKSNVVVGTPRYMSPEQLRNENLDGRSDLYAAGMMMYEMFTGIQLYAGNNLTEIVQKKVSSDPKPLSEVRDDLPPALAAVIMHCMARDRDARPENARGVYRELYQIAWS